ncbi:uracil-DNA glycosylase [Capnocytophaga canimorsus]|uniref:Uracil-DNA glycosylase n=1 Tax=Capnocytophaga canimorsus TaxID=28188 RepID=A0A0B7IRD5_9FLAO|nr:uracil-DNA glycosylase [Capnocytophaga canimorsus]ATA91077.1 uracil-DNA glycosylase [Capnocytophaga canimorsus]AWL77712.1 uracil-DNA glycosylase [Capnocytophaga canimorsus]AYW36255.1 uracil-DNA glycosylase [Capnocytophaga canimorsus]MDT9500334.1 uracil-DNA glycosylase [Capnocytophaga canimorsus]CEN52523.1 uracil-DNA-glycosylase [Capnocytophaga canimorsus]
MNVNIHPSWKPLLQPEFEQPYFQQLVNFVKQEYATGVCYPKGSQIFSAFDHCPLDQIKVVIIGQDPYHGVNQANGLCFSVHDGIEHPPSLVNIFKEIQTDLNLPYPQSGNLERWALQGVLLLNATLTVRAHQAGSHQNKGWETFTDAVIHKISSEKQGVVFLLWGGYAKKKMSLVDGTKHCILTSGHPSPLSANRGYWFGNKHFSQSNQYLKSIGKSEIDWS